MPKKTTSKTNTKVTAKKVIAKKAPAKKAVAAKASTRSVAKAVKTAAPKKAAPTKAVKKTVKKAAAKPAVKTAIKTAVKKVAPVAIATKKVAAKPVASKAPVKKPVTPADLPLKSYKVGAHVVYPTHGVGKIVAEETQKIGDIDLHLLVIAFDKDKMTLRVPVHRASTAGLRLVSSADQMKKVFTALKGRARTSRGMWSRRAQEYEAKINSGNIFSIAEVVRDLHQNVDQSERSYSERMIYESALGRLVGELAAAEGTDVKVATDRVMKLLRAKHGTTAPTMVAKEAA